MRLEETAAYIDHGLEVAHRKEKLFSDAAKMEIFKRTNGIARQVNRICYNAIVNGAIQKKNLIDSSDLPVDEL
jgi:type II secretory pathway predicted ATPase ExeA